MLLRKTKALEKNTERLLNKLLKIGLSFNEAMSAYLENGDSEKSFSHYVEECDRLETDIDKIRKDIEHNLYTDMLIPESRGDVLGLLETLDDVADNVAEVILKYDIEKPVIPGIILADMQKMREYTLKTIEELINAVSSFFKGNEQINIHIQKVKFFENEIDRLENGMNRKIFSKDIEGLATRLQLQSFIEKTADISDCAEHVCERLAISVIKRSI